MCVCVCVCACVCLSSVVLLSQFNSLPWCCFCVQLCSAATVKLTTLVQTKLISSSAEASFILGFLHDIIVKAVEGESVGRLCSHGDENK